MKKFLCIVIVLIMAILVICGGCSKSEHPALEKSLKDKDYELIDDYYWRSVRAPDIIDVHADFSEENWWNTKENLNIFRKAWQKADAGSRIETGTIKNEVIFRIIGNGQIFYVEYDPAEDLMWSENHEKTMCFLDIPEDDLPAGSIFSVKTTNESGNYIGGAVLIDGETVSFWKSGCCLTWKSHFEEIGNIEILDSEEPGLLLYSPADEKVYKFEETETGSLRQSLVADEVIATDVAVLNGKKNNVLIYKTQDGRLMAKSSDGGENLVTAIYTEVKWPFILKNDIWYIAFSDLRLLEGNEKGTPYIMSAIGRDEPGGYAERTMNAWFDKTNADWRGEYLATLRGQ